MKKKKSAGKSSKRGQMLAAKAGKRKEPEWSRVPRANIIHRRRTAGLSQGVLAEEAGFSQAYLSAVETGIRVLDMERLFQLAAILKTTPAAIVTPGKFSSDADIDGDLRHHQIRPN